VLAVATTLVARAASAQDCRRPTDAAGAAGFTYGASEVRSFGNPRVLAWYVTAGPHAVRAASSRPDGVPDDVADVAAVTGAALDSYLAMGYRAPVSDAVNPACGPNGGDGRLDVYLVDMAGADGALVVEPGRCEVVTGSPRCAGFIVAQANFEGLYPSPAVGMRTVLPHEAFHAVQNAYDASMDRFWAEGTAQWAAKTLDRSLTDLERYLPAFFGQTSRSLDAPANGVTAAFLYGTAVWPVFLEQRFGPAVVRSILEAEADGGRTALAAADVALRAHQSSLAIEFSLFSAWNAAAGATAAVGGYSDGARYPSVSTVPLPAEGAVDGITSGLASFFYSARFATRRAVSLATDAARNTGTVVPIADGRVRVDRIQLLSVGESVETNGDAIVIVSGITTNKTDAPFTIVVSPAAESMPDGDPGCACAAAPSSASANVVWLLALALGRARRRRSCDDTPRPIKRRKPSPHWHVGRKGPACKAVTCCRIHCVTSACGMRPMPSAT
jgi:MYXO-CTERM domain-containing protein